MNLPGSCYALIADCFRIANIAAGKAPYLNPAPPGLFPYPRPPGVKGGGGDLHPTAISGTNGRIKPREAVFESSPRDLSKAYLKI